MGKMEVKNTILRLICHLEHCKSINRQKTWLHKQNNIKSALYKAEICCTSSGSCRNGQHLGKMEVKNTKFSILWPICHLEHCKSINGHKIWFHDENNVLFCLCNHFLCPFMDLQCSKWQIVLIIEDFVFLPPFTQNKALLQLFEAPYPV